MNKNQPDHRQTFAVIRDRLKRFVGDFDSRFADFLVPSEQVPEELMQAVRYTALLPGKRIRPYLVCRSCELSGGRIGDAWPVAAAVECTHVFSLIHDDLPAMDDDDFRRGQPACHVKFGEAVAILAGDALVVLAFELLALHVADPAESASMMLDLARGLGWTGMIGGQTADILGQEKPPQRELAEYIHDRKTAALFSTACRLGATLGGADPVQLAALTRYGQLLGRAFQIADDLLDVHSTAKLLGKPVGKDAVANKQTFLRCIGGEPSRTLARQSINDACAALEVFGPPASDLCELAEYVVARNY